MPFFYKKNKFKLSKDGTYENAVIIFSDDLVKNNDAEKFEILKQKIYNFFITLHIKCPNFNPDIFLKNYKKTMFNLSDSFKVLRPNILGQVTISVANKFYLKTFDVVNHEFLHLASIKKDVYDSLFFAYEESYTRLLATRYFNENNILILDVDVLIIKNIEAILGKDFMEKKYFKGDLYSTIKELYKYESEDNIKKLLYCLKKIYNLQHRENNQNEIQEYLNTALIILVSCLKNKIERIENVCEINKVIESGLFVGTYKTRVRDNLYKFNLLDKKTLEEILDSKSTKKLSSR